jgi:hypothetical protein
MPMRAVALAMLLCFPAFAQQKPSLLPADEQPLPLAVAPIEHSASWQFAGLLEGIVTGALLFSLTALATRNQSSGLTKADDAIVGGWTAPRSSAPRERGWATPRAKTTAEPEMPRDRSFVGTARCWRRESPPRPY